jgi:hypothetical protein
MLALHLSAVVVVMVVVHISQAPPQLCPIVGHLQLVDRAPLRNERSGRSGVDGGGATPLLCL